MNNIRNHTCAARGGFALVISLTLMAFLVLLMISLTTLAVVEFAGSQEHQRRAKAKQNALLGLKVAIGQLQATQGMDQRITARADILMDGTESDFRRYWTGVWNSDPGSEDFGERIAWLVSGDIQANAHLTPVDPSAEVQLVGAGSAVSSNEHVWAQRVSVGSGEGHFAYWVGDEGVKARYNLPGTTYAAEAGANPSSVAPDRFGIENLSAAFENMDTVRDEILRVSLPDELSLLHDFSNDSAGNSVDGSKRYFHILSYYSRGVLSDARDGGLKYDLTAAFENNVPTLPDLGSDMPELELFGSYYRLKDQVTTSLTSDGMEIAPRIQTAQDHGVFPQMILFRGNFGMVPGKDGNPVLPGESAVSSPAELYFTMRPVVILANPYNVDLAPADYQVVWEMEPGASPLYYSIAFYLESMSTFSGARNLRPLDLLGGELVLNISNVGFRAGEVKIFTLAGNGFRYEGSAELENGYDPDRFFYVPTGTYFHEASFTVDGNLDWEARHVRQRVGYFGETAQAPTFTCFSLRLKASDALDYDDATVYESVIVGRRYPLGIRDSGLGHWLVSLEDMLDYGYHAAFQTRPSVGRRNDYRNDGEAADMRNMPWLANSNLRSPRTRSIRDAVPDWNAHPLFHWNGFWTGFRPDEIEPEHWHIELDGTAGTRSTWAPASPGRRGGRGYFAPFHVPRSPLLSMGQLQHVNAFTEEALQPNVTLGAASPEYAGSYSVGHSWANLFLPFTTADFNYRLNEALWDRYYFSGYVDGQFLNPRIQMLDTGELALPEDLDDPQLAAAGMVVEGAFNVNSTSVESWVAVLSSLRGSPIDYLDVEGGIGEMETESGLGTPVLRSVIPGGRSNNEWNGFRALTDDQITNLAGQIVHQVRLRGPFLSLSEFVNRDIGSTESGLFSPRMMGALQAAIDNNQAVVVDGEVYQPTGINLAMSVASSNHLMAGNPVNPLPNDAAGDGLSINRGAPGYLTQGDLLTLLGSFIAVRSDTFIIRAYGDSVNPLTGETNSRAWCEAIVQRLPVPVSDPQLGRQLRIVAFRWLSPGEI